MAVPGQPPAEPPAGLFEQEEREEQTPRSLRLLWQFFFFPLLIVAGCLLPIVVILSTRGGAATPADLLESVEKGGANAQKQAAQQLAFEIAKARTEADARLASGQALEAPPFFAAPGFTERLRAALQRAIGEEESEERQIWLARALGRTGDPASVPALLDVLYPAAGARRPSGEVRRAAALGLLFLESRAAQDALVRCAADPEDGEVRAIAMNGLALLGVQPGVGLEPPALLETLRKGLSDTHNGVRLNAAVGLAVRGRAEGLELLERSLSRDGLDGLGVGDPQLQTNALVNAVRGVVALSAPPAAPVEPDAGLAARVDALKPRIESLARDDGDENVRHIAREGLLRWRRN